MGRRMKIQESDYLATLRERKIRMLIEKRKTVKIFDDGIQDLNMHIAHEVERIEIETKKAEEKARPHRQEQADVRH